MGYNPYFLPISYGYIPYHCALFDRAEISNQKTIWALYSIVAIGAISVFFAYGFFTYKKNALWVIRAPLWEIRYSSDWDCISGFESLASSGGRWNGLFFFWEKFVWK